MARSSASKKRIKAVREGKRDPLLSRSPFAKSDLRSRTTKTKQEALNSNKYKNRISYGGDGGSYLFSSGSALRGSFVIVKNSSYISRSSVLSLRSCALQKSRIS